MASLTFDTTDLRPARFERALLRLADWLRTWALWRMARGPVFDAACARRRDLHARLRIGL